LPGNIANATNRIGIFTQSAAGSYAFYKNDKLNIQDSKLYIVLLIIGVIAGVLTAVWVSNEQFTAVFRILMVVMLLVLLVKPQRWLRETDASYKMPLWVIIPVFLGLGFYGGFIQMGFGIFFLAVMVLGAKYSLIDANAVKLFSITIYSVLVIAIFQWKGLIDWRIGALMAVGQTAGGYLTATYAARHKNANVIAHRLLVVIVILAIFRLFGVY
jgi:uncharacterized membrane protein YfcA